MRKTASQSSRGRVYLLPSYLLAAISVGVALVVALDFTRVERKQIEESLRKREAELKETQRLANLGGWKWVVQTDTFTCSEEVCRIFGRDPEQSKPSYKQGKQIFRR